MKKAKRNDALGLMCLRGNDAPAGFLTKTKRLTACKGRGGRVCVHSHQKNSTPLIFSGSPMFWGRQVMYPSLPFAATYLHRVSSFTRLDFSSPPIGIDPASTAGLSIFGVGNVSFLQNP